MRPLLTVLLSLSSLWPGPPLSPSAGDGVRAAAVRRVAASDARTGARANLNVLILLADDLGVDSVGAYAEGNDIPTTPNIDSLAASGVLFRNAWSQPVCSPTRACIQTGQYSFRHGIGFVISPTGIALDLNAFSLPKMLNEGTRLGYAHSAFGKWHLGNAAFGGVMSPNLAGYGHFSGTPTSLVAPENYFNWTHVVDGVSTFETQYEPEVIVNEAITWMNAQTKPFLCYLAFNLPHDPFHRPPDTLHTVDFTGVNPDPKIQPRPYYRAMVEAMDTLIGRILTTVDPVILANTVIIFAGDNGTPSAVAVPPFVAAHGKSTVFEGGVNVPLIVSGPPVAMPGTESAALVHLVDIYATVAEAAGVDYVAESPGTKFDTMSLFPYLANSALPSMRSSVFTEIYYPNGQSPPDPLGQVCPTTTTLPGFLPQFSPEEILTQEDIGFGGPGSMRLEIKGQALSETGVATLTIESGPPNTAGLLFFGNGFSPMPFGAGTLVPAAAPFLQTPVIVLDGQGRYTQPIPHQLGFEFMYFQSAITDMSLPGNFAISNAVKARSFAGSGAIRNAQYKFLYDAYSCEESLFDLLADPFEQNNLLGGQLSINEAINYSSLKSQLLALLSS